MCGICLTINGTLDEVTRMGAAIKHRGIIENITEIGNVKVYFTALPITDKCAPIQPFKSGKWTVWLNGYISNYKELAVANDIIMETDCDTELLAKFIDKKGLGYLGELNGFFAIVVHDGHLINCFTDRYGIKQLYKYEKNGTTYIASEIKAIKAVQNLEISEAGANEWLYSLGIMNRNTIYEGVTRAHTLPFLHPMKINIDYDVAKAKLKELFDRSIERNKVTGLKTGVFLSGGIDSGIIARHINPDYCFSMDYMDDEFSEIANIKKNTAGIHMTMVCNQNLFKEYIHETISVLDDLKAGSSYTNLALTELASQFCTVLYSGAGGDEIFNGYVHRYDKPIEMVIERNKFLGKPETEYNITHKEYDWKFLKSVLVVEDRMAGNFAMETRYPLLDNDFVDFALSLPNDYLNNKRILKDISGLHPDVTFGRKRGFSNPHISNAQWAKFALSETIELNKQKP